MIFRGEVWWADLGGLVGSRPAGRRPVVIVQSDPYNASGLATVVVAVITSNTRLAAMPGNVFVPAGAAGLARDSVVNVTALTAVNRYDLEGKAGDLPGPALAAVSRGLASVLGTGGRSG